MRRGFRPFEGDRSLIYKVEPSTSKAEMDMIAQSSQLSELDCHATASRQATHIRSETQRVWGTVLPTQTTSLEKNVSLLWWFVEVE